MSIARHRSASDNASNRADCARTSATLSFYSETEPGVCVQATFSTSGQRTKALGLPPGFVSRVWGGVFPVYAKRDALWPPSHPSKQREQRPQVREGRQAGTAMRWDAQLQLN